MRVFQTPIAGDPLLEQLYDVVSRIDARPIPEVAGDWVADIADGVPIVDRNMPRAKKVALLQRVTSIQQQHPDVAVRAIHYYPAGGGMGWHTNSQAPGWRVYVPHVMVARPLSGMLTANECVLDRDGFANVFEVRGAESWHAVFAMTERWSLGVRLPSDSARVHAWLNR